MPPASSIGQSVTDDAHNALIVWSAWMRRNDSRLGYPKKASGIWFKAQTDWDDLCGAADESLAMAVDAIVDGMTPYRRYCIAYRYLATSWPKPIRFDPDIYKAELDASRIELLIGLKKRGIL